MKKHLIFTLIVVSFLSYSFLPVGDGDLVYDNAYPYPEPTTDPNEPFPSILLDEQVGWCDTLPAENNVCAWGLFTEAGGLTRWYVTKDGPIDVEPDYAFCITWGDVFGHETSTCLPLRIHSYHSGDGVGGSGRNLYVTNQWLMCGSGYIYEILMTNISGTLIQGDIRQPNIYYIICSFLPFNKRA